MSASLSDLPLRNQYRSDRDDLLQDFYIPCLERSVTYDRAVGFFSSTALVAAAKGLSGLIQSGGKMRLVASPHLSREDVTAIEQGLKQREEVIAATLVRELEQNFTTVVHDRLACLAWLLSQGVLDIKLAVYRDLQRQGIYHEKLGLFQDADGHQVAFSGSVNESAHGFIENFECIDVFRSWRAGDDERIVEKQIAFDRLWQNQTDQLDIVAFPEAATRSLLRFRPHSLPKIESELQNLQDGLTQPDNRKQQESAVQSYPANPPSLPPILQSLPLLYPTAPPHLILRPYQQQAIDNWFANQRRGTLKMATGSGKTITALAIVTQLYEQNHLQALVVVCPYRHLVQQWDQECRQFGLNPILAFERLQTWQGTLQSELYAVHSGHHPFLTVITTNTTLMSRGFQAQLRYFPEKTLIVGDEAHNLGAKGLAQKLPPRIPYRLALSATPERYGDEIGTQVIYDYFGNVIQPEFTLRDAIKQGALVHYRYYPILVGLTETEAERYTTLTKKIRRLIGMGELEDEHPALTPLMMERSRLVGGAANKLTSLRDLMRDRLETSHTLFYCGDGTVEDAVSETCQRQLAAVSQLLGKELGYRVNTYTAETPLAERYELHQLFETGDLQGLVAIRCLDEGVDIPATQTAVILASSNNPRQFIQRRGRILRPHPQKTSATLFDMIVVPPDTERDTFEMERQLLRSELIRFVEFADLADNSGEARLKLLELQRRYELLDL
jgi:DNA phosphorothioation system restriction enzyme